jgi:hypothetical protein
VAKLLRLKATTPKGIRENTILAGLHGVQLICHVLDAVGRETVEWLRSYTNRWKPGPGGTRRRQHPGNWADITHDLERSYKYRTQCDREGATLHIWNDSGHAVHVDAMDGYFVVRGIMDREGPVARALVRVIPRIAPGWRARFV